MRPVHDPWPRPPTALGWAVAFDLCHLLAVGSLAACSAAIDETAAWLGLLLVTPVILPITVVMLSLRRGAAWAWAAQLVLICLSLAIISLPGLLWVPLLVAWCSPPVRDWFDPPLRREF